MKLALHIPQLGNTRAMTDDNENEVDEIDVLIFDPLTTVYISRAVAGNITTDGSDKTLKKFQVDLLIGTYDLLFLANSHSIIEAADLADQLEGYTKADIAGSLKFSESDKWDADPATFRKFPMWGELSNITIDTTTDDLYDKTIYMMRSVARIDVALDSSLTPNLFITSVHLYMPNDQGQIIPDAVNVGTDATSLPVAIAPSVPSTANAITTPVGYFPTTLAREYSAEIYTMEAIQGSLQDWNKNTCLVIGIGSKVETGSGATRAITPTDSIHYYRVDFIRNYKDGVGNYEYMPILRNHCYQVTVQAIHNNGFYDPDDAWRSEPYGFSYEITERTEEYINTVDPGDEQYYLHISQTYIEALSPSNNFFEIEIDTNHPEGWEYSTDDAWIHWFHRFENNLYIEIAGYGIGGNDPLWRTGTIQITAGNLTNRIKIYQRGYTQD